MKRESFFLGILCFAIIGCSGQSNKADVPQKAAALTFEERQKRSIPNNNSEIKLQPNPDFNFRIAAKKVTPGVVHIKSTYSYEGPKNQNDNFWFRFFFGGGTEKPQAEASGVIVSSDGYIVTNDHVVEDAENIEIILQNQKSYKAKVIGIDPETDLALLKIEENNLTFIEFGNSNDVEVGDWVLAVGNPFNLTSTVTAGIVSAKARNIDILKRKGAVESYIQTDAAINPGNSGGALVDYTGKLIGITSAIATPTGAYAGYSFAVPVNIVKKIIDDLLISGKVKRGYLGMILKEMTSEESKQLKTDITSGVFVDSILEGGAAMEADMKTKDIITAIDDHEVTTSAQLQEILEQHHPGEKVSLKVLRKGKEKRIELTLKEFEGKFPKSIVSKTQMLKNLGIKIKPLTDKEKKQLKVSGGVKVTEISKGKIYYNTNIKEGFIITRINGTPVNTEDEFIKAIENSKGNVTLEGLYPDFFGVFYYGFNLD